MKKNLTAECKKLGISLCFLCFAAEQDDSYKVAACNCCEDHSFFELDEETYAYVKSVKEGK